MRWGESRELVCVGVCVGRWGMHGIADGKMVKNEVDACAWTWVRVCVEVWVGVGDMQVDIGPIMR